MVTGPSISAVREGSPRAALERFEARVEQPLLDDLAERLQRTRWPDPPPGAAEAAGIDLAELRDLVEYWRIGFDWRAAEERLNRLPQFRAALSGGRIHFIHQRGRGPRPLPLVITHGWPGSVLEMLELIPRLTDPTRFGGRADDSFDVVAPSLPGYGFSDPPTAPGMHPGRIAELWLELMDLLGYARFGAQGGDWGASVATRLALRAPGRMAGLHLNYLPGSYRPALGPGAPPLTQAETEFLAGCDRWGETEGAYAHVQRTKPDTLAVGLADSPAGLAGWMAEKLWSWSDRVEGGKSRLSRDEVLANVTLYWLTGNIGSSIRLYREASRHPLRLADGERIRVPTGMALFPAETPANPPREWVTRGYDVTRWTSMPRGGHFAAWEEPDLLAADIREFFRPLRGG
jgi:pimeloyl-ACP methyl ester carboxylesterase